MDLCGDLRSRRWSTSSGDISFDLCGDLGPRRWSTSGDISFRDWCQAEGSGVGQVVLGVALGALVGVESGCGETFTWNM